jgi:hypothetical protein
VLGGCAFEGDAPFGRHPGESRDPVFISLRAPSGLANPKLYAKEEGGRHPYDRVFHEWNQLFNWIPIYIGMAENDAGCHPGESPDPVLVFDPAQRSPPINPLKMNLRFQLVGFSTTSTIP